MSKSARHVVSIATVVWCVVAWVVKAAIKATTIIAVNITKAVSLGICSDKYEMLIEREIFYLIDIEGKKNTHYNKMV